LESDYIGRGQRFCKLAIADIAVELRFPRYEIAPAQSEIVLVIVDRRLLEILVKRAVGVKIDMRFVGFVIEDERRELGEEHVALGTTFDPEYVGVVRNVCCKIGKKPESTHWNSFGEEFRVHGSWTAKGRNFLILIPDGRSAAEAIGAWRRDDRSKRRRIG